MLGVKVEQKLADLIVEMFKKTCIQILVGFQLAKINSIEAFSGEDARR